MKQGNSHSAITRDHSVRTKLNFKIQLYISFNHLNCEMGHNRRLLKVTSIAQIIMSAIFLALGMADRYEARFIYTSYLFMPCWIAALVSTLYSSRSCPSFSAVFMLKDTKLGRLKMVSISFSGCLLVTVELAFIILRTKSFRLYPGVYIQTSDVL